MDSRPQNIGIKAFEIYFPSQVRLCPFAIPAPNLLLGRGKTALLI